MTWIGNQPGLGHLQPAPTKPIAGPEYPVPLPSGVVRVVGDPADGQAPVWNGSEWVPDSILAAPGWEQYDPVVTPGTGALTSYNAVGATMQIAPGQLFVQVDVSLTTIGTAASNMEITIPAATFPGPIVATQSVLAREIQTTGKHGTVNFKAGAGEKIFMDSLTLDGATIWADGYNWQFLITIPATLS